jgi:hypothetical protein
MRIRRQPRGAFIFLGPTSCGKTELVYRFVEYVHGDRRCVLKIDGSEYMVDGELTKLKGATNMWAGRVNKQASDYEPPKPNEKDTTCELNPHNLYVYARHHSKTGRKITIILIDEWDKACRDFNDVWLSIMRDGFYTNGGSEEMDFSDVIIFYTGNIGSREVEEEKEKRENPLGFMPKPPLSAKEAEAVITKHLKQFAAPEFRARINELGEVVFFDALTPDQVFQVCGVKVREATEFAKTELGVDIVIGDDVKRWLLKTAKGDLASVNGGLSSYVLDVLDNELIKKTVIDGDSVTFSAASDDAPALEAHRADRKVSLTLAAPGAELDAELARAAQALSLGDPLPLRLEETDDATKRRIASHIASHRPGRHNGVVDDAELQRRVAAGKDGKAENAEPENAEPSGRLYQPVLITAILENEAAVTAFRSKLAELSGKYDFTKKHEEIDPVTVTKKEGDVKAFRVKTHVTALAERMLALKQFWPGLKITIEEVEIPS